MISKIGLKVFQDLSRIVGLLFPVILNLNWTFYTGMTGIDNKKLQSFDGLTQVQKTTRVEWIVKELKDRSVKINSSKI